MLPGPLPTSKARTPSLKKRRNMRTAAAWRCTPSSFARNIVNARLSRRRPRVRVPSLPPNFQKGRIIRGPFHLDVALLIFPLWANLWTAHPENRRGLQMPKLGSVRLFKQIKIHGSWKHAPALFDTKGRVRRDHVRVAGKDEVHEEGSYFLEWWDAGRRLREPGGPDAFVAAEKAKHKQAERAAIHSGIRMASPAAPTQDRSRQIRRIHPLSPELTHLPDLPSHAAILRRVLQKDTYRRCRAPGSARLRDQLLPMRPAGQIGLQQARRPLSSDEGERQAAASAGSRLAELCRNRASHLRGLRTRSPVQGLHAGRGNAV